MLPSHRTGSRGHVPARPPRRTRYPDLSPPGSNGIHATSNDWPTWADIPVEFLDYQAFDCQGEPNWEPPGALEDPPADVLAAATDPERPARPHPEEIRRLIRTLFSDDPDARYWAELWLRKFGIAPAVLMWKPDSIQQALEECQRMAASADPVKARLGTIGLVRAGLASYYPWRG
jgi:hypothetical protein